MGGMIVQTMALAHPERVRSLTSIMSTTGKRTVGWQHPSLLPVFLVAGDTVWRDATGSGLGVELRADPQALLGHQVVSIGGPFSNVMLSVMEAIERVATPREVPAHLLLEQWQETTERLARDAAPAAAAMPVPVPRATSPGSRR